MIISAHGPWGTAHILRGISFLAHIFQSYS